MRMRMYEPDPHASDPEDFRALFLGERGESAQERRIREAAARDVLAELIEEGRTDAIGRLNAAYALLLSISSNSNNVVPMTRSDAAPDAEGKAA
ncbi:hypothetical protein [Streptomyces sp. NBC_01429]|uniref:hypothetical protein n=1 Tax=Streptomyces sp. NBC_01429 TaxID=2903862 RepID=UPI002E2C2FD7|nr:hypothetical protein [Streptomyces sp. NBC_01429]